LHLNPLLEQLPIERCVLKVLGLLFLEGRTDGRESCRAAFLRGVTGTSIALTATVTAASGTTVPTGTVTFLDGATSLGMSTLEATGKGTFSTSSLAVGTHTITANYAGTTGFAASTSSATSVSITVPVPDFALTISPSSGTETKTTPHRPLSPA
jgi:Bacterial Ig-like domain (group 3)